MRGINKVTNSPMLSEPIPTVASFNKPIELYVFINPLHESAFEMLATIRKLQLEYDHYFTWRFVLSSDLVSLNSISEHIGQRLEQRVSHPVLPSLAIKAAELQGKRAGLHFLAKLQEYIRLNVPHITSYETMIAIAEEINLDMVEFTSDFSSKEAARALQCDLYIRREMEVDETPSIVFFNECIEDEGLNVSGTYDYNVYEHILEEMLEEQLVRRPLPTMEDLFRRFTTLSTNEIAFIYSLPLHHVERELKKRMLQQKVERKQSAKTTFWRLRATQIL